MRGPRSRAALATALFAGMAATAACSRGGPPGRPAPGASGSPLPAWARELRDDPECRLDACITAAMERAIRHRKGLPGREAVQRRPQP